MMPTLPRSRFLALSLILLVCAASRGALSQTHQSPPSHAAQQHQAQPGHSAQEPGQPGINEEFGQPLAAESAEAAGAHPAEKESEDSHEKMVEELKFSPSVRWMSSKLGVAPEVGYWVGIGFDFAVLAVLIVLALKKSLPGMLRDRTRSIQRGIEEARKASAEANQRLADIETRLSKLDSEVAAMRAAAEQETADEEQRLRAAGEQERQRIVASAEADIEATAKLARRELKAFAADLAVNLAERRIRVDAATDQRLVHAFVGQLAKGVAGDGSGKDEN